MDINQHFNLLLNKYDLIFLYYKYIVSSIIATTVKEGFYWLLLFFSSQVKNNPQYIKIYSIILIAFVGLNVPVERLFNSIKNQFIAQLKIANTLYFNERIIKMSKQEQLTFDLVEYFNILDHFNDNLQELVNNIKNKYNIPVRIISLIIVAVSKKFGLLIGLFAIFYALVKSLSERKLINEDNLTKKYFTYENIIRNYIINAKNFLINDELNQKYLNNNINKFENINLDITELNNKLDMKINILLFVFIIIVITVKYKELDQFKFFFYFLIIYDIEFVADRVQEYYKTKISQNKMQERLNHLNKYKPIKEQYKINSKINKITINQLQNDKPKLSILEPIIINPNDHILVNGESGSGKTSLLYLLKGIIKPHTLDILPNIEFINSQTYITLPNHKSLFNGKLFDIISNYDDTPNTDLIINSLKLSKIYDKLYNNSDIIIEKLSSGERIRLLISRIIYAVKSNNYNILLFDEIDENLNDNLAVEICQNLKTIFHDKIILYITHNEQVKNLFDKQYTVKNGIINQ
jgi:ABC-type lipoprotein export system ATPase subunit